MSVNRHRISKSDSSSSLKPGSFERNSSGQTPSQPIWKMEKSETELNLMTKWQPFDEIRIILGSIQNTDRARISKNSSANPDSKSKSISKLFLSRNEEKRLEFLKCQAAFSQDYFTVETSIKQPNTEKETASNRLIKTGNFFQEREETLDTAEVSDDHFREQSVLASARSAYPTHPPMT